MVKQNVLRVNGPAFAACCADSSLVDLGGAHGKGRLKPADG